MIRTLSAVIAALLLLVIWQRGTIYKAGRDLDKAITDKAFAQGERDEYARAWQAQVAQSLTDRKNLADANGRAAKANKERDDAKATADSLAADIRAGRVQIKPRFACPAPRTQADPAGSAGASGEGSQGGLLVSDAEFLVRFAADADQAVIERNEAVEGWMACRAISEGQPVP